MTEETIEKSRRESLAEFTVDELRQKVDEMNEDRVVRIPYGKDKDALISNIMDQDFYELLEPNQSFTDVSVGTATVPLSKIERCPLNPRHEVDYLSTSLQDSIDRAQGLTKAVTVVHASELGSDDDVYYALAGNRSLSNLREVVENRWDEDPETFMVDVLVRTYEEDGDVEAQILSDLESDNEEALDLSPIDKLKLINARLNAGRSKSSIARERGVSAAYVSEITKLNVLPERIKELIHFGCRIDLLEGKSKEELESFNVPFDEDDNGNVTPKGITYSNGIVLASAFPAAPTKTSFDTFKEFQQATQEWEEEVEELGQQLLEDGSLLEDAMNMSKNNFKVAVSNFFSEGEGTEPETKTSSSKESSSNNDSETLETGGSDDGSGYSGVGSDHNLVRLLMEDSDEFADRLEDGNIMFVEHWQSILAEKVRLMDGNVIRALRTLFIEDVLDEFEIEA